MTFCDIGHRLSRPESQKNPIELMGILTPFRKPLLSKPNIQYQENRIFTKLLHPPNRTKQYCTETELNCPPPPEIDWKFSNYPFANLGEKNSKPLRSDSFAQWWYRVRIRYLRSFFFAQLRRKKQLICTQFFCEVAQPKKIGYLCSRCMASTLKYNEIK